MNINADVNIPEPPGSQILVVLRCWPYGTVPIFYNCIILSTIFSQVIETKKFPEYDYAIGYSDLKEITKTEHGFLRHLGWEGNLDKEMLVDNLTSRVLYFDKRRGNM